MNNILKSSLDHANNKNKPIKTSNSSDDELNSKGKDEMDKMFFYNGNLISIKYNLNKTEYFPKKIFNDNRWSIGNFRP